MTKPALTELEVLIRSRYPLIVVESYEESRVIQHLAAIAESRSKRLQLWSASRGFFAPGSPAESQKGTDESSRDPLAALDQVVKFVEPAIFVMLDFHPYLQNPLVVRRLREVGAYLKSSYKSLVLLSPRFAIPMELEKEVSVVQFGLPGRRDLETLIDRTVRDVNQKTTLNLEVEAEVKERLVTAALGLTWDEAENVVSRILVQGGRLTASDVARVIEEKERLIKRSGVLEYFPPQLAFGEVGGLQSLKEWLDRRRLGFTERARAMNLPYPKGALLIGVQGCGKSLVAKAVSGRWQMPLLRLDVGRIFGSLVGSSEENIRRAVALSESVAPAILWVDEVEKAFSGTKSSGASDGGTTARVFGSFITWLQEKTAPVFVIATANDISALPAEFLRKGRFDEIFFVDLPQADERLEILRIHLQKRGRDPARLDLAPVLPALAGFSGAEIEEAVVSAMYAAFEAERDLTVADLIAAANETVPLSKTMVEDIEALRKWAAGRARRATPLAAEAAQSSTRNLEL